MLKRTNEEWLADLQAEGPQRADALNDLWIRLTRSVYYYLSTDRSDLSSLPAADLQQMAEDFVQDATLKILDNLESFRGESQFMTWASKIATRVAISELRRARYRDFSLDHLTAEGETMPSITSLAISPSVGPRPENYTERLDVLNKLQDAIDTVLTERQRTALVALTMEGMPVEEIARRMDSNRNALYKLIHDARVKLKEHFFSEGLSMDYILDLFAE